MCNRGNAVVVVGVVVVVQIAISVDVPDVRRIVGVRRTEDKYSLHPLTFANGVYYFVRRS